MEKSSLIIVSVFLLTLSMLADNYKIIYVNTETIKIGNKVCKKGDIFSDKDTIYWTIDSQAFKARNMTTKSFFVFSAKSSKNRITPLVTTVPLRGRGEMSLDELGRYLSDEFFLLDSIRFETPVGITTDSHHYFLMLYNYNGNIVQKKLKEKDGVLAIPRSMFPKKTSDLEFTLTILYVNKKMNEDYLLTESMKVVLLPLKIHD